MAQLSLINWVLVSGRGLGIRLQAEAAASNGYETGITEPRCDVILTLEIMVRGGCYDDSLIYHGNLLIQEFVAFSY